MATVWADAPVRHPGRALARLLVAALVLPACATPGRVTDAPGPEAPRLSVVACAWDPSAGELVIDVRVQGAGAFRASSLGVPPEQRVMRVTGIFPGGERRDLGWASWTVGEADALRTRIETPARPVRLVLGAPSFAIQAPARVTAPSLRGLAGRGMVVAGIPVPVTSVMRRAGWVGVELHVPSGSEGRLIPAGLIDLSLRVGRVELANQGLDSVVPSRDGLVQRTVFLRDLSGAPLPRLSDGPAVLEAAGLVVQITGPTTVDVPSSCA